jgi:hypothetical protein
MADENIRKQRAGHQEIHGETIAKFEFFDAGWNPYSRYLDDEKVDLILRRRKDGKIQYREIQVKYRRLFPCGMKWDAPLFAATTWGFFHPDDFIRSDLFVAVIAHLPGTPYSGDIFIFPAEDFRKLILSGIPNKKNPGAYKVYFAKSHDGKWYLWRRLNFKEINADNVIEIDKYRRAFEYLN